MCHVMRALCFLLIARVIPCVPTALDWQTELIRPGLRSYDAADCQNAE